MKRLLPFLILVVLVALPRMVAGAQESTPSFAGCTVAPMPQERIDQLAAMAAASPVAGLPAQAVALPDGAPVSAEAQARLFDTLMQINACSWANDLPRLLTLYSERYIVSQFFAPETVPIVPVPERTPTEATPIGMPTDQQPMIFAAVSLPDGRIAALVSPNSWGGNQQIVWFVQDGERWLVDQTAPAEDGGAGGTGAAIPVEAQAVVDLVIEDAAQQLGVEPSSVTVTSIEAVDWPDSALGCPEEGGVYAPVISPGYRIIVTDGTTSLEYHTGPNDAFVQCSR